MLLGFRQVINILPIDINPPECSAMVVHVLKLRSDSAFKPLLDLFQLSSLLLIHCCNKQALVFNAFSTRPHWNLHALVHRTPFRVSFLVGSTLPRSSRIPGTLSRLHIDGFRSFALQHVSKQQIPSFAAANLQEFA